jgi:Ca2+/Na+ antiporter
MLKAPEYVYSFGLYQVFIRFLSGGILDAGRIFPVLTVIAIAAIFYLSYSFRKKNEKFALLGLVLGFILFSGGQYLTRLPIMSFFELHRFIFLFHFFLIILISIFIADIIKRFGKAASMITALIFVLLLFSTFYNTFKMQRDVNNNNPIYEIKEIGNYLRPFPDGRAYVYFPAYEPSQSLIYYYSNKPILYGFSLGSQDSISTRYIRQINPDKPEAYADRYNVKYIILNSSIQLPLPNRKFHNYTLYFFNTTGYFKLDDCGSILSEKIEKGTYSVGILLYKKCDILFKMTYSPYWKAYSGNQKLLTTMTQDALISISADKSKTEISMRYEDIIYRKYILLIGLIVLIVLYILEKNNKL